MQNDPINSNSTESSSNHNDLEKKSVIEILKGINDEDKSVAFAVEKALPQIEKLVISIVERMKKGGRLFYIGAGTSGRLGILDASECPPTYGVNYDTVLGIIAGGEKAIKYAVENAEDDTEQAWKDILYFEPSNLDTVVGIAASGKTPYVIGGLKKANELGLLTGCIVCNTNTEIAKIAHNPVEIAVGPEYVTGSTRMKSGTAQKMVLNMLSTSVMIQLGKIKGNKMVDMQLSNNKLVDRGIRMIMSETSLNYKDSNKLLKELGSVRKVIDHFLSIDKNE
jgi:N-acetylmuramic acid 6-phosphate etherase